MNWQGDSVLVVGLGESGWSMARYLLGQGAHVRVCDSRDTPPRAADLGRQFPQVGLHCGPFRETLLDGIDWLAVSPGVDLRDPLLVAARSRGLPLRGDIELFARAAHPPVVAVTGSNGKSTVVSLLAAMGQAAGRKVVAGGNLGRPALDLLDCGAELVVLELSSFQLDLLDRLDSLAAVVLNLSDDHLDRHGSFEAYAAAKGRIYRGSRFAVVNLDDPRAAALADDHPQTLGISTRGGDFELRLIDGRRWLCAGEERWLAADELAMVGRHNALNVLAAFALGQAAGLPREAMIDAARRFPGLPHRSQLVAERHGVRWINDSKGTNVGATLAALEGLEGPVVLLAGGQSKGADFRPWRQPLAARGRAAVLFGADAAVIEAALADCLPLHRRERLEDAVACADGLAQAGDSVLLSPGCASFDQFSGFEDRGRQFVAAVEALS